MKIALIGSGVYGFAMAKALMQNPNNKVTMWTESESKLDMFYDNKFLDTLIPNYKLPKNVKITTSYEEAVLSAELIFIMVTAQYVNDVTQNIKNFYQENQHIIICTKGIEQNTGNFAHEIVLTHIKTKNLAIISGPSFAVDLASGDPIGLTLATSNKNTAEKIETVFDNTTVKIRQSEDIIGVEFCGSVVNVIGIASGIIVGLGYSISSHGFMITECLHDIKEMIIKLGGNPETILSFAGIGDLLIKYSSEKSRNFKFGLFICNSKSKDEIDNYLLKNTVEGYYTIKSISSLIKKHKMKFPLIDTIYKIVVNGENPEILIKYLIQKK